jgi:NitT/TauT family transport system substrate-binding protein
MALALTLSACAMAEPPAEGLTTETPATARSGADEAGAETPPSEAGEGTGSKEGDEGDAKGAGEAGALIPVRIGLPFQPDIQFAPIYVAESEGHFTSAGLDPTFEYGDESTFLRLLAAGKMDAVVASGEQVILAQNGKIPVVYVATWYQRFPVVVFSLDAGMDDPSLLAGKRVGLPMAAGASYIGWKALLAASGIPDEAIDIEIVGFNQLGAVRSGAVDAAVGYAANEPVQLAADGESAGVIEIADKFNLVSNGIIVAQDLIDTDPERVQAIVDAFLAGLRSTLQDPDAAYAAASQVAPPAEGEGAAAIQRAVLEASLRFWEVGPGELLGHIDRRDWEASNGFLTTIGLVDAGLDPDKLFDARFVERAGMLR